MYEPKDQDALDEFAMDDQAAKIARKRAKKLQILTAIMPRIVCDFPHYTV